MSLGKRKTGHPDRSNRIICTSRRSRPEDPDLTRLRIHLADKFRQPDLHFDPGPRLDILLGIHIGKKSDLQLIPGRARGILNIQPEGHIGISLLHAGLNVCVLAPTREFPSMGMAISNYIAQVRKGAEIDTSYIQEYIQEDHQKSEELIAKVKIISKTKKTVKKKTTATKKDGGSKSLSSKTVLTSSAKMAKNL